MYTLFITVSVRRTCLMLCSWSQLRRHEDYDQLLRWTNYL